MLLSIVIPHYNESEEVIRGMLSSIDLQIDIDFNELEILIVNDGSTVQLSEAFLGSFKKFTPSVVQLAANMGPGMARQAGVSLASGDYILFCDSDDVLYRVDALRDYFAKIRESHPVLIYGAWVKEATDFAGNYFYETIEAGTDGNTILHGKAFQRKFLQDHNIVFCDVPGIRVNEDISYLDLVSAYYYSTPWYEGKYVLISEPTYIWKFNTGSLTRTNLDDTPEYVKRFDEWITARCWAVDRYANDCPVFATGGIKTIMVGSYSHLHRYKFSKEKLAGMEERLAKFLFCHWDLYLAMSEDELQEDLKNDRKWYQYQPEESYHSWVLKILTDQIRKTV